MALLTIGTLDLSEYCEKGDLSINRTAVYFSGFEGLNGQKSKALLGYKYQISAAFTVPDDVKKTIENACKSASVNITFGDTSADFNAPDFTAKLDYETSSGVCMWTVNISSVCDLAPSSL